MMDHAVLLVDDDDNTLSSLVRALHKQPYQIYTARDGGEAVWILKTHKIDLIVADERMPEMPGSDLLAWAAKHCPDVVRIVLTGHAETLAAIRAINEGGVYHFFSKPCNEVRLAVVIREALEQKEKLDRDRQSLETSRQQLRDLERLNQDFEFQTRIICQDLQRPLQHIMECCRQLEEQYGDAPNREVRAWIDEVRNAVTEVRRMRSCLQAIAAHQPHVAIDNGQAEPRTS
jgi:DNA-binding NtrC family response regulator